MKTIILYLILFNSVLYSCLTADNPAGRHWTYIQVDDSRQKWGDWDKPGWLRYFGLDAGDLNGDAMADIVSGRYVYLNPGGDISGDWKRVDLGANTDGALILDVDGDRHAYIISTSLPDVYWWEAENEQATQWKGRKVAMVKETGHVNGQGFAVADIVEGGKLEILLAAGDGIYLVQVPDDPAIQPWPSTNLVPQASDEGFAVGDLDGDGDLDIAASAFVKSGEAEAPLSLFWWENPGDLTREGKVHFIHTSLHDIDRIVMADLNGDGRMDIAYSEERYPGKEPDSRLVWLQAPQNPAKGNWNSNVLVTQYSMNNLDCGDIDNDGDVDLTTNEHKGQDYNTQVFLNDGKGNFTMTKVDDGREMHLGARLFDLDGDGDLDIYGHAWDHYQFLHVWRNEN